MQGESPSTTTHDSSSDETPHGRKSPKAELTPPTKSPIKTNKPRRVFHDHAVGSASHGYKTWLTDSALDL